MTRLGFLATLYGASRRYATRWYVPQLLYCVAGVAVRCSALQCVAVCCRVLQYVAVCCSVLQCVAVCCSVDMFHSSFARDVSHSHSSKAQQLTATQNRSLQHTAVRYSIHSYSKWPLQCVAVCCSVLECVAVRCNNRNLFILQAALPDWSSKYLGYWPRSRKDNTLQHTATHCNALQHIHMCHATQEGLNGFVIFYILTWKLKGQHTVTHCNTLQCTATHYNTLQHT